MLGGTSACDSSSCRSSSREPICGSSNVSGDGSRLFPPEGPLLRGGRPSRLSCGLGLSMFGKAISTAKQPRLTYTCSVMQRGTAGGPRTRRAAESHEQGCSSPRPSIPSDAIHEQGCSSLASSFQNPSALSDAKMAPGTLRVFRKSFPVRKAQCTCTSRGPPREVSTFATRLCRITRLLKFIVTQVL